MSDILQALPTSWKSVCLGDVATVVRGVTYKKFDAREQPAPGLVPVLRANNIEESLIFDDLVYVPEKYVNEEQVLRQGDIVIAASSGSRKVVGKAAILSTPWVGSFGAFCFALRPSQEVSPKYLGYYLKTSAYRNRVSRLAAGININNLKAIHLQETPLPLPSRPEQDRIVTEIEKQFTRLDAAIASLEHARNALKSYRMTILKAAYEGQFVPTEVELTKEEGVACKVSYLPVVEISNADLPAIPEGWCWTKIECLAQNHRSAICAGPFGTIFKARDFKPTGIPIIFLRHVKPGTYLTNAPTFMDAAKWQELFQPYSVKGGELLITKLGEPPGVAAIYPHGKGPAMLTPDVIKMEPNENLVLSKFLMYYLNSPVARRFAFGAAFGTTRLRLTLSIFRNIPVPLPSIGEQIRIVNELERRLSVVKNLETFLDINGFRRATLKRAILDSAFSGKLSQGNSNDEPVSILLGRIRQSRESAADSRPRRGRGIKPEVSTPGPQAQPDFESRRDGGSDPESASAPSGLLGDLDAGSLGLKPQALRPGPVGAETSDGDSSALLHLSGDQQTCVVWEHLVGMGPLHRDDAIRTVAGFLRYQGLVASDSLRNGSVLWHVIANAIDFGVKKGLFDRPRRGEVRALLPDARDYSLGLWSLCLLVSMGFGTIDEDQALRAAAEEARKRMGLKFERLRSDGVILQGLREALEDEVRQGHLRRQGGKVWLTPVEELEKLMDSEREPQTP